MPELTVSAAGSVDDLRPQITPRTHPAFHALYAEGPFALMGRARREFGFAESPAGYVSKCDLCFHVRRHLVPTGRFPDLAPKAYYARGRERDAAGAGIGSRAILWRSGACPVEYPAVCSRPAAHPASVATALPV